MSQSSLRRALHRGPSSAGLPRHNSTQGYVWQRPIWVPQPPHGIARRVEGKVESPTRENRPHEFQPLETSKRDLLGLLHGLGMAIGVRAVVPGKLNFSNFDPLGDPSRDRKMAKVLVRHCAGLTKKGITERFVRFCYYERTPPGPLPLGEVLDGPAVAEVFTDGVMAYLERMGCRPEDVMAWVWILMTKDGTAAVLRLDAWAKMELAKLEEEAKQRGETEKTRRLTEEWKKRVEEWQKLEEDDRWSWNWAFGFFKKQEPKVDHPIITTDSTDTTTIDPTPDIPPFPMTHRIPPFLLLFILRFPRLPATTLRLLLPYITASLEPTPFPSGDVKTPLLLLIRLLRQARITYPSAIPHIAALLTTHLHPSTHPPPPSARLTALYNRLLTLFSLPSHDRPFKSLPLHQRSQFLLLRKMASLNIPLTREGYRALTTVQLGHQKTPAEAAHTQSMSPSWPPWPVPRDGHPLTPPPLLSRAAQVLQQMSSVGYGARDWEAAALILAGTDTDRSPTIQTRTLHPIRDIWAARVRATRTVEEAWCVFSAALDSHIAAETWSEMFAKLISARKARVAAARQNRILDAMRAACEGGEIPTEVIPTMRKWDLNLREAELVRAVPGEAKEVLPHPSGGVFLPSPVPSIEELFQLMKRVGGTTPDERLVALLVREAENLSAGDWVLKQWSKERWRRLVKGLSPIESLKTPPLSFRPYKKRHHHSPPLIVASYLHLLFTHTSPDHTYFAIRLLLGHAPPYPPAWNTVLSGLATALSDPHLHHPTKLQHATFIWHLYKAMLRIVPADTETLRILCVAAERAQLLNVLWDERNPVDHITTVFNDLFSTPTGDLPPLVIPEPAALHAYVRVLGFAGRHEEIVKLLVWMRDYAVPDTRMARRVLVAARLFLHEGGMAQCARGVVDEWEGAGGWPREEEVERYCIRGGIY